MEELIEELIGEEQSDREDKIHLINIEKEKKHQEINIKKEKRLKLKSLVLSLKTLKKTGPMKPVGLNGSRKSMIK